MQISEPFPSTFPGNFIPRNLCTLVSCVVCTSTTPQDYPRTWEIDWWVSDHLIPSSEGTWFFLKSACVARQLPAPNVRATKPTHRGASAILFAEQHYYPPQKTVQTKATWWSGKPWQLYLIPLRHSRGTSINHRLPAPDPSGPFGCNLSQDRRRWHGS